MGENILEMMHITKAFPGVVALDDVSFTARKGDVHALVGENGAGKSTLIKILNGLQKPDKGTISFCEKDYHPTNTLDAEKAGISFVFQEFNLIPSLSVAENIFLGKPVKKKSGFIDTKLMLKKSREIIRSINAEIDPSSEVSRLSSPEKQMVEIAKALNVDAKLLVMDEPSATLTKRELEKLFDIVLELKGKGISVVYISHRLEEVFRICDSVTILRDGRVVSTDLVKNINREKIIEQMVGRSITEEFPTRTFSPGEEILRVENLSTHAKLKNVSFSLRKGEILGLAGLVGAGRTEIARAVFGADPIASGKIYVQGRLVNIASPTDAMKHGIALLPEERKVDGLTLPFSVKWNTSIGNLGKTCWGGIPFINQRKEASLVGEYVKRLSIRASTIKKLVMLLSGGNQQKVVVAKWLFAGMDILILDEPTRGIDVGAKLEIYNFMAELVRSGKSIILISSELHEVLALSDRVIVVNKGEAVREFSHEEASAEEVISHAIS